MLDLTAAREAADALVEGALGLGPVRKAAPNPLTPQGFDAVVLQALAALKKAVRPAEQAGISAMLQKLERGWGGMTPAQQQKATDDAALQYLKIARDQAPAVGKLLRTMGPGIMEQVKAAAATTHGLHIQPTLDLADRVAADHVAHSQVNYVRDALGKRAVAHSQKARSIVSAGLEAGLDRYDIAKQLSAELGDLGRSDAYYQMVASTYVARARSWSTLRSYDEAGITAYEWSAVTDEISCDTCRLLDGRVFPVAPSLARMHQADLLDNPEEISNHQPWARTGINPAGERVVFYEASGRRQTLARVDESGVGKKDAKGSFSGAKTSSQMQAAGIGIPPVHGHCRCVILPVWGTTPERTAAPAAPPTQTALAPPPPPRKKKRPAPSTLPTEFGELAEYGPYRGDYETLGDLSAEALAHSAQVKAILKTPSAFDWDQDGEYMVPLVDPAPKLGPKGKSALPFNKPTPAMLAKAQKAPAADVIIGSIVSSEENPVIQKSKLIESLNAGAKQQLPLTFYKKEGKHYLVGGKWEDAIELHTTATAKLFKGETTLKGHIIDGDALAAKPKKPKAPKAPPAPPIVVGTAPPLPKAKEVDADTILGELIGGQAGSNKGGLYRGKDGIERYVKFYDDPAQAHGEHLANSLYREMGMHAPESQVFAAPGGKVGYASTILPGGKTFAQLGSGLSKEHADKFLDGFVGDVLTGNWDAIGTGKDNAMLLPDGRVFRIDNGGTFLFRAKAGKKPDHILDAITEWDKFFEPGVNPHYADVAKRAGVFSAEDISAKVRAGVVSARRVATTPDGWLTYIDRTAPGMDGKDRVRIAKMLSSRQKLLEGKLAELDKPKPPPLPPGVVPQWSTTAPRKGLRAEDLPVHDHLTAERAVHDKARAAGKMPRSEELEREFSRTADREIAKVSAEAKRAIVDFSDGTYGDIRHREEEGRPDARSDAITRAYAQAAPAAPRTVYRTINLRGDVVGTFVEMHLEQEVWGFGRGGKGATTSTTWALGAFGSQSAPSGQWAGGSLKVVYKVKHRSGIAIQTISAVPGEKEILMSRNARFRTTGLSWGDKDRRLLIIEAEEIDPDAP